MPSGIYIGNKGKQPWNKGRFGYKTKPHTEETKRKISESNKGKVMSPESIEKTRQKNLGRKFSEVAKLKMSLTRRGDGHPNWKGGISKDKDYQKKQRDKWVRENYQHKLWLNNKRRIRKMGNGGVHSLYDWETLKAQYNWTCPSCKVKEPNIILTRDHIIPLIKGGSDNIENIQPLCKSCNCRKHDKIINKYLKN